MDSKRRGLPSATSGRTLVPLHRRPARRPFPARRAGIRVEAGVVRPDAALGRAGLLLVLLASLLLCGAASGYSGNCIILAMKTGPYAAKPFAGTQAGFDDAKTFVGLGRALIQIHSGCAYIALGDLPDSLTVLRVEGTQWEVYGKGFAFSDRSLVERFRADSLGVTLTGTLTQYRGGDVASASSITLAVGNVFSITGTTTISAIAAKPTGTIVVLEVAGALTITDGVTLQLAGNFVGDGANGIDTLTLVSDGSGWFELARSHN